MLPSQSDPCFLVTIVPQLTLFSNSEVQWLLPHYRTCRVAFLPIMVRISLFASVAGMGLSGGALGHSLWAVEDLNAKLQMALDSTAESLS